MRPRRVLFFIAIVLSARVGGAQELPFRVSIVDWDHDALERQRRAFRSEAGEREVLYCVETWSRTIVGEGIERIVITSVRREQSGRDHRISDVGEKCMGQDGTALPMFHTHTDGNCQFSPRDLVTIVTRAAPFDGVQCGERHFIWAYAWQLRAIANSSDRERLARAATQVPD